MPFITPKTFHTALMGALALLIACSNSLWDEMPSAITSFISQYYPGATVSRYEQRDGSYYVTVKDGPSMTFDSDYHWTMIDGNGVPLPPVLIYNEMPRIYAYLEAREEESDLYKAENQPRVILLTFADFRLEYIKENGEIRTYTGSKAAASDSGPYACCFYTAESGA